jgi:hypothetical protein
MVKKEKKKVKKGEKMWNSPFMLQMLWRFV